MISIIIPFYNEADNLNPLYRELKEELEKINEKYEIIFVDDGSTDEPVQKFKVHPANGGTNIKIIHHAKKLGKGQALVTGLKAAVGDIVIFMDADFQDDPADIKKFLDKINEGYDLVNGVRLKRKDNTIVKLYSNFGNRFLKSFVKSPFTDINCGFKAFKRSILDDLVIYGNNFRFLPLDAFYKGFKVGEVAVNNRSRLHGKSKFGSKKLFIGMIDTATAYFLFQFSERPLHFFGIAGGIFFSLGAIILIILAVERLFLGWLLYRRPILFLGLILVIVGVQIVMTGMLGELIVYLDKRKK